MSPLVPGRRHIPDACYARGGNVLASNAPEEPWYDRAPPTPRRRWSSPRHDAVQFVVAIVALVTITGLVIVGLVILFPPPPGPPGPVPVQLVVNTTAPRLPVNASFWGINVGLNVATSPLLADAVGQSPVHVVRFPGGAAGDRFNYTAGTLTNDTGVAKAAIENLSAFVGWCRTVGCAPILELPGEIDDPSTAAYYVGYVERTFGLHPIAWEVGNEPALWTHFGTPWSAWALGQQLTPSPAQYARVVQAYISAIHRVDPTAPVLGLPGVGVGAFQETAWINATISLNGPNLTGVAIHAYPAGSGPGSGATLTGFLANATGPHSLTARLAIDRLAVSSAFPRRPNLPIFVTELGTGLSSGTFAQYAGAFPSVPMAASELVSALAAGVASVELTQVQTPQGGSWMDGAGNPHPLLPLYTEILPELGPTVAPLTLRGPLAGLSALVTAPNGTGPAELLVANANATVPARLELTGAGLDLNGLATSWSWNSSTAYPVAVNLPNAPSSVLVPPASVLLLRMSGGLEAPGVAHTGAPPASIPAPPAGGPAAAVRRER